MIQLTHRKKSKSFTRFVTILVIITFSTSLALPPSGFAQSQPIPLPPPGTMVNLSPVFTPPILRGITIDPNNPLQFDFIIDSGDSGLKGEQLREESERLVRYFLAALTLPQDDMWVNLSPVEKDRIAPEKVAATDLGRDLLAQDYILKQLTASLIYPESDLGKQFWQKIYKRAQELYGTTDIPVNTFNKVWILPDKAVVYESNGTALNVDSHLKVMLEEDYLAMQQTQDARRKMQDKNRDSNLASGLLPLASEKESKKINKVSSDIVREVILPAIEKEVNEGQNFARLRQIYNAVILATWFKRALKDSLLGQVYADKGKILGVDLAEKDAKEKIYQQYLEAYKKGVYNYIKEDYDPKAQEAITRKYISGGIPITQNLGITTVGVGDALQIKKDLAMMASEERGKVALIVDRSDDLTRVTFRLTEPKEPRDEAMMASNLSTRQKREVDEWAQFLIFTDERQIILPWSKPLDYWRLGNQLVLPNNERLSTEPTEQNFLSEKLWRRLNQTRGNLDRIKAKYGIAADEMIPKEMIDEIIKTEGLENLMETFTITGGVTTGVQAMTAAEAGLLALYFSGWQASNEYGMADLAKYYFTLVTDMIQRINQRLSKKNQDQQAQYKEFSLNFGQIYTKLATDVQAVVDAGGDKAKLEELKAKFIEVGMDLTTNPKKNNFRIFYQNTDYANAFRQMYGKLFNRVVQIAQSNPAQRERKFSDALDQYFHKTANTYMIDYMIPFFADGDTGHGKLNEQLYYFVKQAMAASIHLEDQTDSDKKCGHMAGKVKVPRKQHVLRLVEGRVAALLLRSRILFIARTDTEETKLLSNLTDISDHPFIKGTLDEKIQSLEFFIRLARREDLPEAEGKPYEQVLEEISTNYPEFKASIQETWRILEGIRSKSKDKRYDPTTDNRALRQALEKVSGQWADRAKPITFIDAVTEVLREREDEGSIKKWIEETNPIKRLYTIKQLQDKAKADFGISFYWDYDKPRTYEGYYQVKPGVKMAIVMAREYKKYAEIAWMEQKGPHFGHAYEFAAGVNQKGDAKRVFLALNLSPSFNWSNPSNWSEYLTKGEIDAINAAYAREDFDWQKEETWGDAASALNKLKTEIRKFSVKMALIGYGFQFVTIFSDNVTTLAMLQAGRNLLKLGVAGFVEHTQQISQRRDVQNLLVTAGNQNQAAALLNAAVTTMSAGGVDSFVDPTGSDATQSQFGLSTPKPPDRAMLGDGGYKRALESAREFNTITDAEEWRRLPLDTAKTVAERLAEDENAALPFSVALRIAEATEGNPRVVSPKLLREIKERLTGTMERAKDTIESGNSREIYSQARRAIELITQALKSSDAAMLGFRQDDKIGNVLQAYNDVLTPKATEVLEKLAPLTEKLAGLRLRREQRFIDRQTNKKKLDFLPETNPDGTDALIPGTNIKVKDARAGNFEGATIPQDLQRQWIQLTGPAAKSPQDKLVNRRTGQPLTEEEKRLEDLRNVAHALLSGADAMMFDGEDALGQLETMSLDNIRALVTAYKKDPAFWKVAEEIAREYVRDGKRSKDWNWRELIEKNFTTRIYRVRGVHLDDRHIKFTTSLGQQEAVSATIADMVTYLVNAGPILMSQGSTPTFYLPKLQTAEEAAFMAEIIDGIEDQMGWERGTVKVFVLIEQLEETFQLMEMRAALGKHFVGFNTGRWDYIADVVKQNMWDNNWVPPNFKEMVMTYPYMFNYETRVRNAVNTPDRNGNTVLWIGGMEPQIPVVKGTISRADREAAIENAMKIAENSKLRELSRGASGTWVAHPGMVERLRKVYEENLFKKTGKVNQLGLTENLSGEKVERLQYTPEEAAKLTELKSGARTIAELRFLVSVAMQYVNAYLTGRAAAALKGADLFSNPLALFIMEDMATGEGRTKLTRKWMKANGEITEVTDEDRRLLGIDTGARFTHELVRKVVEQEYEKLQKAPDDIVFASSKKVELPIAKMVIEKFLFSDVDLPWLIDLANQGLNETDLSKATKRVDEYIDTYKKSGGLVRLTVNPLFKDAAMLGARAVEQSVIDGIKLTVNDWQGKLNRIPRLREITFGEEKILQARLDELGLSPTSASFEKLMRLFRGTSFFGPYMPAVEESLRFAFPDTVQALVVRMAQIIEESSSAADFAMMSRYEEKRAAIVDALETVLELAKGEETEEVKNLEVRLEKFDRVLAWISRNVDRRENGNFVTVTPKAAEELGFKEVADLGDFLIDEFGLRFDSAPRPEDVKKPEDLFAVYRGFEEPALTDAAMLGAKEPVGGIDFNAANLNLQIKRDENGVPLPLNLQPIDKINIEGFIPVIINIVPMTNIAPLLGIAEPQQKKLLSSLN